MTNLTIKDLIEVIKKLEDDDPYAGYIAADYYDGKHVYLYKPQETNLFTFYQDNKK